MLCCSCSKCHALRFDDEPTCPKCGHSSAFYVPGPIRIASECLGIQATWSSDMEQQRRATAYQSVGVFMRDYVPSGGLVARSRYVSNLDEHQA